MHLHNGRLCRTFLAALCIVFCSAYALAGVTASISGTIKDPSGASVAGATVAATNVGTGIAHTETTNDQGFFSFQTLPVGKYTVEVQKPGFKVYRQTDITVDVNSAVPVDVVLQVGQINEKVEVSSNALHVETINSQMGEVIEGKEMTDVPLVTRSYTDLLALQPGVVPTASGMSGAYAGSFISAGFAVPPVSGDLNSGAQSVNGMRESANAFILNGVLVQEIGYSGAGAIPNLDSLAEFRILTNNTDAEYGNYAGAQINVVTKSGTNSFHGNVFEFLRNTDFDAKNYFDQNGRGAYHQNQFGGTIGGPILKDKLFFFADYQGNRRLQAVPQTIVGAPSTAMESGDFSGIAASFDPSVNGLPTAKLVTGADWASQLSTQLGQTVTANEPYYFTAADINPATSSAFGVDCTSTSQCVLPNAQLAATAFNPISQNLLKYILPAAASTVIANGPGTYSTSAGAVNLHDNKFSGRLDANTGALGLITAYYYFDKYTRVDPYWAGNAPLYPGFSTQGVGHTHNLNIGFTKTLSQASVNEFRVGFFRLDTKFNRPLGGTNTTLAQLGFASGANGAPGIYVGTPSVQGVPEIDFNNFVIGVPSRPNQLLDNIYQVVDNISRIVGTHSFKFGGQFHFNQLEENLSNVANGNFFFGSNFACCSSETGDDFVDFLLGAPSQYVQGQSYPSYGRSFYFGLYAQDSWRARPNLTVNYGLRYDVSSPWWEKYNEIQTIIPGEQSVVFKGSPTGWLFPGDPHVPRTLAPTRWGNFAPRLGMAYSFGGHEGFLGKLLGKPGESSIRLGYTFSYASFEGATDFNEIGDAPFGDYAGPGEPSFNAPFTCRATCAPGSGSNIFPVTAPPKHFSASHPGTGSPYDTEAEFLNAFGTIGSSPAFFNGNRLPYAQNYELSLQRQVTSKDLITASYVGTQGRRLLSSVSANPGNPALCLSVSTAAAVLPNTPTCGPGGENNIYFPASGGAVLSTRSVLPGVELTPTQASAGLMSPIGTQLPDGNYGVIPFGNDSYFITAGSSSYNSAQIDYRHTAGNLQLLLGYTYSKAMDDASGYGEQFNPINARLSRGLAAFDSTNNFVVSYNYALPFNKIAGSNRLTNGWALSGITRFSTGLPVTIVETDDQSLLGTSFGGPIILPVDTPNLVTPVHIMNPRGPGNFYFSTSSFQQSGLGQEGDSRRRFFHGPGINNWDMALVKDTRINERMNVQFRAEFFNLANHAQFLNPSGISTFGGTGGSSNTASFGVVSTAAPPRIGQLSLKLNF